MSESKEVAECLECCSFLQHSLLLSTYSICNVALLQSHVRDIVDKTCNINIFLSCNLSVLLLQRS